MNKQALLRLLLAGLVFGILMSSLMGESSRVSPIWSWSLKAAQGDPVQEALREFGKGKSLLDSNRFESAKPHFFNCLRLLADEEHPTARNAYNNLGRAYFFLGQYDSALIHYQQAATLNTGAGDSAALAQNLINIGNVFFLEARYERALQTYLDALRTCESLGMKREASMLLNNIGGINFKQSNLDKALDFYKQSAILKEELGDSLGLSKIYNNLSEIMQSTGKSQEAKEYLLKSVKLKQMLNDQRGLSFAYNNLAELFLDEGNRQEAIRTQQRALEIQESLAERAAILYTRQRLADYLTDENPVKAQTYLDLPQTRKLGSLEQLSEFYRIRSQIHEAQADPQAALRDYKMYKMYQDSVINREKTAQLAELQSRYELDKKDREIRLLSTENQLQQTRSARQQLINKGLIGGFILLLVLFTVAYYSYRVKKRSSLLLKAKNDQIQLALEEREVLLKEIHHRVKNNLQIIASLLNLQTELKGDKEALELLQLGQDRIQTMSIIHERMYKSEDLARITFKAFIEELINYFRQTYQLVENRIVFSASVENVPITLDKLVPCGLILNELITNSIKYAFPEGKAGTIWINGFHTGEDKYCLEIVDSGAGPAEKIELKNSSSLGLSLVQNLVRQMKGAIEEVKERGFGFRITFGISPT